MSFCTQCGFQLVAGAKFCSNCGKLNAMIANNCSVCGNIFQPGQKFCTVCGSALLQGIPPPTLPGASFPPAPVQSTSSSYTIPVSNPTPVTPNLFPEPVQNINSSSASKVCENCGGDLIGKKCSIC